LCVEAKELNARASSCDILRGKSRSVFSLLWNLTRTPLVRGVFNVFCKGAMTWQNETTETIYSAATRKAAATPTQIAARRARAAAARLAARRVLRAAARAAAKSATAQAAK
jgi:hypothetical protein